MPHIKQDRRDLFDPYIKALVCNLKKHGDMTYIFASIVHEYVCLYTQGSYADMSAARATLHDAYDEYYRCVMGPHEQHAIERNGSAFEDQNDMVIDINSK